MSETDRVFAGSIPVFYDRYLGPLIFVDYADDLARRAAALHPARVLETAAGTGIVTRALARTLAARSRDRRNRPEPADARFCRRATRLERVSWRQADAQRLPFDDGSFDAVVCQFGVMFFPDRVAGYREARRVLQTGRAFPVQRVGPDRGERIFANRDQRGRGAFPGKSAAILGAHAARLSRCRR